MLANIYLDPLDWLLEGWGVKGVRYADDIVILCRNAEEAARTLEKVKGWLEKAGLTAHPEKTRVVDMDGDRAWFELLGYRFLRTTKGKLVGLVRERSRKQLRGSLKPDTWRANGRSLETVIARINPKPGGWYAYFQQACLTEHQRMDQWVRMRLRSILRKRHRGKGRGHGRDHLKWPNRYFEDLGLFSLERAREQQLGLLRGATG